MRENAFEGLVTCGFKGEKDLHSCGPEIRTNFIIHYVISGSGFFRSGRENHTVCAGQSFIIYPYTEITYGPDLHDPWSYVWVDFTGEKYHRILRKTALGEGNCVIGKLEPEKILPFFGQLTEGKVPVGSCTAEGLLRTILGVYADHFPVKTPSPENKCFTAACHLIQGRYHHADFGVNELCTMLGVSRTTLHRIFKNEASLSPGIYLANYRIACSKELLNRGASVKGTALSCGFTDPLYFSKAFKAATGVTPSEYRRQRIAR